MDINPFFKSITFKAVTRRVFLFVSGTRVRMLGKTSALIFMVNLELNSVYTNAGCTAQKLKFS